MNAQSNYGTIPTTTTHPHAQPTFMSRAAAQTQTVASEIRPWRTFFDPHSLSKPLSYPDTLSRIKSNLRHFRYNYALSLLIVLFLTLLYHPLSMIAFLLLFVIWAFVYFFRERPVVLFSRTVDDRVVFCVMAFVTLLVLDFTNVGLNLLVGSVIGVLLIGFHAAFRVSEDSFVDEDDSVEGGLVAFSRG